MEKVSCVIKIYKSKKAIYYNLFFITRIFLFYSKINMNFRTAHLMHVFKRNSRDVSVSNHHYNCFSKCANARAQYVGGALKFGSQSCKVHNDNDLEQTNPR